MPQQGMRWRFITINTKNSWLPGDVRGFRNRDHRLHSSGDYRNPPPFLEHIELRKKMRSTAGAKIVLPRSVRGTVAIQLRLALADYRLKAISVSSDHAHLLVELPDAIAQIKQVIGDAKRVSSKAIRDTLPGEVWSAGCGYPPVDHPSHFSACERYVLFKQGRGTWTWSHKDSHDGVWHEDRGRSAR